MPDMTPAAPRPSELLPSGPKKAAVSQDWLREAAAATGEDPPVFARIYWIRKSCFNDCERLLRGRCRRV